MLFLRHHFYLVISYARIEKMAEKCCNRLKELIMSKVIALNPALHTEYINGGIEQGIMEIVGKATK